METNREICPEHGIPMFRRYLNEQRFAERGPNRGLRVEYYEHICPDERDEVHFIPGEF
jgi:hypothetical protein